MSSDFAVFRGLGEFAGRSNFDSILSGIACLLLENLKWDDGPVSGPQRILVLAQHQGLKALRLWPGVSVLFWA